MDANNIDFDIHEFQLIRPHESLESIRGEAGPIGLTLRLTPSFLNSIDQLNVESDEPQVSPQPPSDDADVGAMSNESTSFTATEPYGEVETGGKLKASNIPLISLQIGDYTRNSPNPNDLAAKIYYAKREMMWEIMERGEKKKIEFKWSHISAIRASYNSHNRADPDVLEIKLCKPPLFFVEKEPTPKKHTQWKPRSDFTNGCALRCRHRITCQNGTLEEHYKRLLIRDENLLILSKKPFSNLESAIHFPNSSGRMTMNGDPNSRELSRLRSSNHIMMSGLAPTYDNIDANSMADILPFQVLPPRANATLDQTGRGYPSFVGNGDHTIEPDDFNMQQGSMRT